MSWLGDPPDDRDRMAAEQRRPAIEAQARLRRRRRRRLRWVASAVVLALCVALPLVLAGSTPTSSRRGPAAHPTTEAPTGPSTTVLPGSEVDPLYLGPGVGIIEAPTPGGCSAVFATDDFVHWRNITPPQPPSCPDIWQSAWFVTPDDGWVLGRNGGNVTTDLFHTLDGGRTWTQQPGGQTGSNGGWETVGFASTEVGWRQQFALGSNAAFTLELTTDGGTTWSVAAPGESDGGCEWAQDVFADASIGFAAAPLQEVPSADVPLGPAPWLWETTDGGDTWNRFAPALPASEAGATALYGMPSFFSGTGVLPVVLVRGRTASVGFYTSSDSGETWTFQTSTPVSNRIAVVGPGLACHADEVQGDEPVVGIASPQIWWVVGRSAAGHVVMVTTDAGRTWTSLMAQGLPAGVLENRQALPPLRVASADVAWVAVSLPSPGQAWVFYQTLDGGRTWSPLSVPVTGVAVAASP